VQTYSLNEDGAATLRRKGTLRIVGWSPLSLASLLVLLWPTKESAELGVPKTLIVALLLGVGASIGEWFVWVDQVREYKLLVDVDAICVIGRGSAYSVLRGQVRTTMEKRERTLRLRENGHTCSHGRLRLDSYRTTGIRRVERFGHELENALQQLISIPCACKVRFAATSRS
jgi:hypothetical protein